MDHLSIENYWSKAGDINQHYPMSIPLSERLPADRLVWAYMPKGNFTIRSAYKVAVALSSNNNSKGSSNEQKSKSFWKTLWRLNIPNKVAWKASKNILPTKANLCRRHVIADSVCEACGVKSESSSHALWDCEKLKKYGGSRVFHLMPMIWFFQNS